MGFGKTRRDVLNIAELYAKQKGVLRKESGITQCWWRAFRDRQGDLSLRREDNTARVHMDAVNEDTISDYFALLQTVMQKHGITNSPGQIYNVDGSGVPLDPRHLTLWQKVELNGSISFNRQKRTNNYCCLWECYWAGDPT